MSKNGKRQFQIVPWQIIASALRHGYHYPYKNGTTERLLATYQWLTMQLQEWAASHPALCKNTVPYEFLNATSSINNHSVNELPCYHLNETLIDRLACFFTGLNSAWFHNESWPIASFARHLGINGPGDLLKPLDISSRAPSQLPLWINHLYGIRLARPGPNEYHPDAIWTHGACLNLITSRRKRPYWALSIEYSYRDESSSWAIGTYQKCGETLEHMLLRAEADFSAKVDWPAKIPEDHRGVYWYQIWSGRYREYNRLKQALDQAMSAESGVDPYWENYLAAIGMRQSNSGISARKIPVTPSRLRTLRRWALAGTALRPSNGY